MNISAGGAPCAAAGELIPGFIAGLIEGGGLAAELNAGAPCPIPIGGPPAEDGESAAPGIAELAGVSPFSASSF